MDPIVAGITHVARTHLDWRGELSPSAPLAELFELDSIRLLTLVVELENHFQICLEEGDELAEIVKRAQSRSRVEAPPGTGLPQVPPLLAGGHGYDLDASFRSAGRAEGDGGRKPLIVKCIHHGLTWFACRARRLAPACR